MPSVLDDLDESERYLWAILSDPSGVDQAEFLWQDHTSDTGLFRCWHFQWNWYRCEDPLQIDQCSRSVGKSLSIQIRTCAFPFLHPGQEMLIAAPELTHLKPVIDYIEARIVGVRLLRELLPRTRNHGITHKLFKVQFLNGATIEGRIPQQSGRGMKGAHPLILEIDEASDFPEGGWVEIIETLKRGHKGAAWRAHGVTRGVRDYFYKFTQPNSGWTVHRIPAMARPTWTDQERQEKIEMYGSRDHPDYKRNILGLHGDASSPLFTLHALMKEVDIEQTSEYNTDIYKYYRITPEMLEDRGGDITQILNFPSSHKTKTKVFWAGMDVGFTNHPSEILVFAEENQGKTKDSVLRLVTRIHMERISHQDQVAAILHVIRDYNVSAFALDKTGVGLPLYQDVQAYAPQDAHRIKGYGFAEKILVDFDTTIELDENKGDLVKDAGIYRNVLEYASDKLRELVDKDRVRLPWDRDLIAEFQGQTFTVIRDTLNQYGRKNYSKGNFHALDAAKMVALAFVQHSIEEFTKKEKFEAPPTIIFGEW